MGSNPISSGTEVERALINAEKTLLESGSGSSGKGNTHLTLCQWFESTSKLTKHTQICTISPLTRSLTETSRHYLLSLSLKLDLLNSLLRFIFRLLYTIAQTNKNIISISLSISPPRAVKIYFRGIGIRQFYSHLVNTTACSYFDYSLRLHLRRSESFIIVLSFLLRLLFIRNSFVCVARQEFKKEVVLLLDSIIG